MAVDYYGYEHENAITGGCGCGCQQAGFRVETPITLPLIAEWSLSHTRMWTHTHPHPPTHTLTINTQCKQTSATIKPMPCTVCHCCCRFCGRVVWPALEC